MNKVALTEIDGIVNLDKLECSRKGNKLLNITEGGSIMGEKASKYHRIEKAEGEKVIPSQASKPAALSSGKMHTVAPDETLSHIALRYYRSAAKEKWMVIYEANQDQIGDNPNTIRRGMELFIPDIEE